MCVLCGHTHGAGGVTTTVERGVGILPLAHLGGHGHAAHQDRDKHYGGCGGGGELHGDFGWAMEMEMEPWLV